MTIRNPVEWGADGLRVTAQAAQTTCQHFSDGASAAPPQVRTITLVDVRAVLAEGWADFKTYRTDVVFICVIYPLAGLLISRLALNHNLVPLLFPVVAGFALLGPFAAAGLYEMSRRHEGGTTVSWTDAFGVFGSPSIVAIVVLALLMTGLFVAWLAAAMAIYHLTIGPEMPATISSFAHDVLTTSRGWALVGVGIGVGFMFAFVALAVSAVSFPLLLDRRVGIVTAVETSVRAVATNPVPMLGWGLIVATSLVLGAIPALLGLIVVMPVLGHATWHLYRRIVA